MSQQVSVLMNLYVLEYYIYKEFIEGHDRPEYRSQSV
jgi:hypothetical protein